MARPRKHNKHLPQSVYLRNGGYYLVRAKKWIHLGRTESEMLRTLADLKEDGTDRLTMNVIFDRYELELFPEKALSTVRTQRGQLNLLRKVFGQMAPDDVKPSHIAHYLKTRDAKGAANREIALLSHCFTCAMPWFDLSNANPCYRVRRNKELGCDVYIDHEEFFAIYRKAPRPVRLAMALAYLTGQRQGDILRIQYSHVKPDGLHVRQSKTGAYICIAWTVALRRAVNRCSINSPVSDFLICRPDGRAYTPNGFQRIWYEHRDFCLDTGLISRKLTFRAIRAKAHTDGNDMNLLGHDNPQAMDKRYRRKAKEVFPVR